VEYVEDPGVAPGGFVVDTDIARFDHTMGALIEDMRRALDHLYEPADG
jgi:hypothetical protein